MEGYSWIQNQLQGLYVCEYQWIGYSFKVNSDPLNIFYDPFKEMYKKLMSKTPYKYYFNERK